MSSAYLRVLRRLWWALLPYYGWTGGTREQRRADVADGAIPAPWYAFPLAWLYRIIDWLLRHHDMFGPNYNCDHLYVGRPRWSPWQ